MIQMYFGKACKEYREEMNISQEKFALSIGMDSVNTLLVDLMLMVVKEKKIQII